MVIFEEHVATEDSGMMSKAGRKNRKGGEELDNAADQLRADIQQGRLVPGQRLVETDMMQHLGVTRGRVRDVFKRIEAEGLVQIDKNRGASVRKISRDEVMHVTEVLEDISLMMIRKAARQLDNPPNRKKLQDSLAAARQFRKESTHIIKVQSYMDENARFWGSLAALAGNPILADIRFRLQTLLFRFAMEGLTVHEEREKWLAWHEDIIAALLKGETAAAVRYAKKSMADVWAAILSLPDRAFSG